MCVICSLCRTCSLLSQNDARNEMQEFFAEFCQLGVELAETVCWRSEVVEEQLVMSIERTRPPSQVIVGSDAKFGLLMLRHFPVWVQDLLMALTMRWTVKPKIMQ